MSAAATAMRMTKNNSCFNESCYTVSHPFVRLLADHTARHGICNVYMRNRKCPRIPSGEAQEAGVSVYERGRREYAWTRRLSVGKQAEDESLYRRMEQTVTFQLRVKRTHRQQRTEVVRHRYHQQHSSPSYCDHNPHHQRDPVT